MPTFIKQFSNDQGRQHALVDQLHNGDDPDLARGQAHTLSRRARSSPPLSWEVLPPEETRLAPSALEHPKARSILSAFIGGATKTEIARVYGLKEKLVRSVIAAAQQQHQNS
jgi:hypothetical protein